jgi:hypothetical protein
MAGITAVLVVFCVVAFSPSITRAQGIVQQVASTVQNRTTEVGVRLGGRLSAFYGADSSPKQFSINSLYNFQRTESRKTYSVGAAMYQDWSTRWGTRLGINLVGRGERLEGITAARPVTSTFELTYLDIPLSIRYVPYTGDVSGRTIDTYLLAGPTASFLLDGKVVRKVAGDQSSSSAEGSFRTFTPAFHFGAGITTPLSFGRIGLEVNYDLGLPSSTVTGVDIRNQGLELALTYMTRI